MSIRPWPWAWAVGGWLYIGSFGIRLGAVGIAVTFRPPRPLPAALPSPIVAH